VGLGTEELGFGDFRACRARAATQTSVFSVRHVFLVSSIVLLVVTSFCAAGYCVVPTANSFIVIPDRTALHLLHFY